MKNLNNNLNVSIIIPSLNPDEKLQQVVDGLIEHGFNDIIIVNDGSDEEHLRPFEMLESYHQCEILTHEYNMGKGKALKDAFLFVAENREKISGVITVDGDNQHGIKDIVKCAKRLVELEDKIILGVRDFTKSDVPLKSRMGNGMTRFVFRFACGLNISDTQTGLRGIPFGYLKEFLDIKGEHFEYETNMLLELKSKGIGFEEVKIETIYINENETTHFNPIKDSLKIYMVIFSFLFSSIMSAVLDIAMFTLILLLIGNKLEYDKKILIATVGARIISSLFNFVVNRNAVFNSNESYKKSLTKYYVLCVTQMMISFIMVYVVAKTLKLGDGLTSVTKAIVDTMLFFISFKIQKTWVFRK